MTKVVDPRYAKGDEYGEVIRTIEGKGSCPFCPENFTYHKEPILREEGGWIITRNSWPYENAAHHFLVICREHKEGFNEITADDLNAIKALVNWAIEEFKLPGGGFALRFGDTTFTGATVCHLHGHLIVPEEGKHVSFPIG